MATAAASRPNTVLSPAPKNCRQVPDFSVEKGCKFRAFRRCRWGKCGKPPCSLTMASHWPIDEDEASGLFMMCGDPGRTHGDRAKLGQERASRLLLHKIPTIRDKAGWPSGHQSHKDSRSRIMANDRRRFLAATATFGFATLAPTTGYVLAKARDDKKAPPEEEVSAPEDLMREHGVLNRILLVYEDGLRRLRAREDVTPEVFHKPATLVRKFVEDYHEKLEEKFIFPEFEKQKKLVDLVQVLRRQHEAGRKVTDVILRIAVADQFRKEDARQELVRACRAFIRMYRP